MSSKEAASMIEGYETALKQSTVATLLNAGTAEEGSDDEEGQKHLNLDADCTGDEEGVACVAGMKRIDASHLPDCKETSQCHLQLERSEEGEEAEDGTAHPPTTMTPLCQLLVAPKITPEEEDHEMASFFAKHRIFQGTTDLYGNAPTPEQRKASFDDMFEAMEEELSRIPSWNERKEDIDVNRAPTVDPLLLSGGRATHAKLFLNMSNFDPKMAAQRMARYWEARVQLFGVDAFSRDDALRTEAADDGGERHWSLLHRYKRCKEVLTDLEISDGETRRKAKKYVDHFECLKLNELDAELDRIPPCDRRALFEAEEARPEMASHRLHRLLFLTSVDFNAEKAARRLVNYWETALHIFGRDVALFRRVTVKSLMEEHPHELSLGLASICPGTDTAGRVVMVIRLARVYAIGGYSHEGMLKCLWYVFHAAMQQEGGLTNGIVMIDLLKGHPITKFDLTFTTKIAKMMFETLPIKICFMHSCAPVLSSIFSKVIYPICRRLMGSEIRRRHWLHDGSDERIVSELNSCGILDLDQIPSEFGGNHNMESYRDWLEQRLSCGK